jgi:hypothetical protein
MLRSCSASQRNIVRHLDQLPNVSLLLTSGLWMRALCAGIVFGPLAAELGRYAATIHSGYGVVNLTRSKRGGLIGLAIGLAAALLLLSMGEFSLGESMEGAMYLALPLSFPIGLAFLAAGVGNLATTWIAFITTAVPLNFAFWGAAIGFIRTVVKGSSSQQDTEH